MAAARRGPSGSTPKLQEGASANVDLEDMRLKTDALVSLFNERYREAILSPPRSSAPLTPSNCRSSSKSNTARSESASVVRFPISSPSNEINGSTTTHPLSHAPPKNISPTPVRVQNAPPPPSAASSDFVYAFTRHTSHFTSHTLHVTRHVPHVTRHTSRFSRHIPHVFEHSAVILLHIVDVTPPQVLSCHVDAVASRNCTGA